jgi:hypothetical protein
MKIAFNETLFRMTCQLWREAYYHSGESLEDMMKSRRNTHGDNATSSWGGTDENDDHGMESYVQIGGVNDGADIENEMDCLSFKWHPFGAFDCDRGYIVSVRLSSDLMEVLRASATRLTPCVSRCSHCCRI